jgi:hypothetical protein
MRGARYVLRLERDAEVTSSDDQGRPIVAGTELRLVQGNVTMLSAREVERAAIFLEGLTAAAHLPTGTDVDRRDRIVLDAAHNQPAGVPDHLAGTWYVGAVRHTRPLLRCLLRRDPLAEEDPGD